MPQKTLDLGNGVTLALAPIPAGQFTMGSTAQDDHGNWEGQRRAVTIARSFFIGIYPVTQLQWRAVMHKTIREQRSSARHSYVYESLDLGEGDDHPVYCVSPEDAAAFCLTVTVMTGECARLPSEAEWEYACRAGSDTLYCFGDDQSLLGDYAWWFENSGSKTHPVGKKKPNAWGLYDMHGQLWEWCADPCDGRGIPASAASDPDAPASRCDRVARGGDYKIYACNLRSSSRTHHPPDYRDPLFGFRIVVDPAGTEQR